MQCVIYIQSDRGGEIVKDFYDIRFGKSSSPFSPMFQYTEHQQPRQLELDL